MAASQTKQLDYIATTSVRDRGRVVSRIRCKDGASLSIQASVIHFSFPQDDSGPWVVLEVALLSGAEVPTDWKIVGNRPSSVGYHTSVDESEVSCVPVYAVTLPLLHVFVAKDHGGEVVEEVAKAAPSDLGPEILRLRRETRLGHRGQSTF